MNITRNLIAAVLMTIVTTVILGIIYPLAITGIAQVAFPDQANGQLIEQNGKVVGSRIIGQGFSSPGYFRSRPSAAGMGYDAANSAGSQLGPTNKKLMDDVKANVEAAQKENPDAPVPIDLVTTSASGFDPHMSPAGVDFQVPRVARERGDGRSGCPAARRGEHRGPDVRLLRRAAGQRAGAEPCARCAVSGEEVAGARLSVCCVKTASHQTWSSVARSMNRSSRLTMRKP